MFIMEKLPTSLTKFFWYFIKKRPLLFIIFFSAPLSIIIEANVIPYALKMLIDTVVNYQGNKGAIIKEMIPALWVGGIAWISLIIIMWLQNSLQAYIIPIFEADIRMSVIKYVMLHSYHYFSNQLAGNIADKVRDFPRAIESIRIILCRTIVPTFVLILTTLVIMTSINQIFCWILGLWVIAHLIVTLYFVRFINNISKRNAEDKSALSGSIVDAISNIISVKLFARYSYELNYIGDKQEQEKASNVSLNNTMNTFQRFMDIAVTVMLGSTMYFLITSWQQGIVSAGDFVLIFNIIFAVMTQMWHLGYALSNLFREVGIAQQALTLITSPHQIIDSIDAKPIMVTKGEIVFSNVTFHYNKGNNIFKNKNVIIKAGQKVGLVGFSGSGKSTFVNLILRFFDVESGVITIDNQDITKVTQESLRENIAVIPQDTSLFHRTLIENIRYGQLNVTKEELIKASKNAYCHDFITQLPNGYNSLVGERGIKLSGGQRQRIAIARAILKNAPIIILDEATSALDSITEKYIQDGLYNLMKGRTAIIIAHRLSTLSKMDRILVFDKGSIIEDGTHEELLESKKQYAFMWKMQVNGFLVDRE